MEGERARRRLAAIVAADVVGYSRLIGADEEGTLARLKTLRRELIDPKIAKHSGRIVKTTGDGLLLEFASAVDALRCVIEIQRGMAARESGLPESKRLELRIGVNVGDIVVDGDDILGDGVNVAARLETIAEPGGICVSARVYEDARGRLDLDVQDIGERQLKNIERAIRVYRISVEATRPERPALPLPDKPSIAVLPFQNMSGDPEQEYFADGMVEEIITALSRFSALFVIARNSSFTYKGRAVDIKQVARELGVRYVLEGSVRKSGQKVRITGQLIDAATGVHLWADKFDGDLADVFDLQDKVAASVVGAIAPKVQAAEIERARRKPTASLDAYDLYLQAMPHVESLTEAGNLEGSRLLDLAILKDPTYARALAEAASCYDWRFASDWSKDRDADGAEALRLARAALTRGADDAEVLAVTSYIILRHGRDLKEAVQRIDRALTLNANSAKVWLCSAHIRNAAGDPKTGIEHGERALRLGPFEPHVFIILGNIGGSYLMLEHFEVAVEWLRRSINERPTYLASFYRLAASLAHLDRLDEAREVLKRYLELHPTQTQSKIRAWPTFTPAYTKLLVDGLAKAGLPE